MCTPGAFEDPALRVIPPATTSAGLVTTRWDSRRLGGRGATMVDEGGVAEKKWKRSTGPRRIVYHYNHLGTKVDRGTRIRR